MNMNNLYGLLAARSMIPLKEAHMIRDQLHTDYYESPDQGHFGGDYYKETFPELLEALKTKIDEPLFSKEI